MRCVNCHSSILPFFSQQRKQKQEVKTSKLFWLSANEPTVLRLQKQNNFHLPLKHRASTITSAIDASSPAVQVDITVFLQTSATLLFVYWIANFVVPEFIMKDMQSENTVEDQNGDNGEKASTSEVSWKSKKQGFNSTKPQ